MKSSLSQVKKLNVQEQIYQQLRENIFSQQWLPGDKIPSENELSQIFNASRVSIRGAIQKLIAQGFLESKQGEGTFVRTLTIEHAFGSLMTLISLSKRNILQVLQYRKMIEVGIAEMIIDNCTEKDIVYLRNNLEEMVSSKNNYDHAADMDLQFHLYLSKMSGNDLVVHINSIIFEIYQSVMHEVKQKVGAEAGDFYHKRIIESIEQKNRIELRKNIEEHLDWTIKKIKEAEII